MPKQSKTSKNSKNSPLKRGVRGVFLSSVLENQEKINSYYRRLGLTEERFFIPGPDFDQSVKVNDIQFITTSEKSGLLITDSQGKTYQTRSSFTLGKAEKNLVKFPQFIRSHDRFIVNLNQLDYFSPSPSETGGRTLTFKNTGAKALLGASRADKVREFFNIKSLEHVEPWNEQYQAIIDENLRTFEKEIRFMSADELKTNFKYQSNSEFNVREFIANMIWEYYNFLAIGKREPIEGNIRTFWYYLKPTLSKAVTINSKSQYSIMIDTFRDLVVNHKLFKYKDFGFISDDEGNYIIGKTHPNIILAGEKAGHFKKLQRIHDEFGITVISLGGMPSILNTEYLIDDLEKAYAIKEAPVHLITLVDYNPSSAIIANTFINQIKHEGVKNLSSIGHLLTPGSFTKEELPHVTDQIAVTSPADKTKLKKWMSAGGGIDFGDGIKQPLGIETEALILDFERLKTLLKNQLAQIINPTSNEKNALNPSSDYFPEKIIFNDFYIV